MHTRYFAIVIILWSLGLSFLSAPICRGTGEAEDANSVEPPSKVYVPYDELKGVFEKEEQGVFLSYEEFQKLWRAAQGKPADVAEAPFKYLISAAKFKGEVKEELATLRLELTLDVLAEGWVQVPIGLGEVAVSKATLLETQSAKAEPLLRVFEGQYIFVTKGQGRYVLALDFVRQLETQPGLAVLKYRIPSAAITTLELLIPEENLKVDVQPMLAATTSPVKIEGANATRLQAFLGSAKEVRLSWKPKTEAAAELEPVVICAQFQHLSIAEALISYEVKLDYDIHRGGVDSFTVRLPGEFRVTGVNGANLAKWDIETPSGQSGQLLKVKLFSPAEDKYSLTVKMERFLQEAEAKLRLTPIITEQVLRRSGLIGITHSPRRLVYLDDIKNLARVDAGQLPQHLQKRPGVTAYRFITSDYGGTVVIETTSPRITVNQLWMLGVDSDHLELHGRIHYKVERTGIFELNMNLPEPWKIESVGPPELVDDYGLTGKGKTRLLHILLNREKTGEFELTLVARTDRTEPEGLVEFSLPLTDANDLQLYQGQLVLSLADQLQAEVDEVRQLQAIALKQAQKWPKIGGMSAAMAFEFRAVDRDNWAGGRFKIAVKPVQISATVHRLVHIAPGSVDEEAVIQYRIRYAPVEKFYLKMPVGLADAGVQISGANIKEKPRIDELPAEEQIKEDKEQEDVEWAYYKIVLQSKVSRGYELRVSVRRPFQAGEAGEVTTVKVEPILAAGKLSDQSGHIAIAKSETLAIGNPVSDNLIPADASSAADLPHQPHRKGASLAFKYNAPPFELSLPVVVQKQAPVFTTISSGVVIEQALARDGMLNTHATYLLVTTQGDRVPITLPGKAELTAVLLNGNETLVEMGTSPDERIVLLPPSAGQVSRFVLEISYNLKNVSASRLVVPLLTKEIPVQQTLWRVWIPDDYCLLGHDRLFSRLTSYRSQSMLEMLRKKQPSQVAFKLPGQGKVLNFIRQGAPGELSILIARKEKLSIVVWLIVIIAGVLMLKLSGFDRAIIILLIGLAAGIVHLYQPLLVERILQIGVYAGILVLLLWFAQWVFRRIPALRQRAAAKRESALKKEQKPKAQMKGQKKATKKGEDSSKGQQEQSKQDQE
jgi:hypothetical protein